MIEEVKYRIIDSQSIFPEKEGFFYGEIDLEEEDFSIGNYFDFNDLYFQVVDKKEDRLYVFLLDQGNWYE